MSNRRRGASAGSQQLPAHSLAPAAPGIAVHLGCCHAEQQGNGHRLCRGRNHRAKIDGGGQLGRGLVERSTGKPQAGLKSEGRMGTKVK